MKERNATFDVLAISTIDLIALITLVTLKLCNVISWSWWWVMLPLWWSPALTILLIIIIGTGSILAGAVRGTKKLISKRGNNDEI